jgi:hypothetical protein
MPLIQKFDITAPHVKKTEKEIVTDFHYSYTAVDNSGPTPKFTPTAKTYTLKTETVVPKMGYVKTACKFRLNKKKCSFPGLTNDPVKPSHKKNIDRCV